VRVLGQSALSISLRLRRLRDNAVWTAPVAVELRWFVSLSFLCAAASVFLFLSLFGIVLALQCVCERRLSVFVARLAHRLLRHCL